MTPKIPKVSTLTRGRALFARPCRTRGGSFSTARPSARAAETRSSSKTVGYGDYVMLGESIQRLPPPNFRTSCGLRAGLTLPAPLALVGSSTARREFATWPCRGFAGLRTCSVSTPRLRLHGEPRMRRRFASISIKKIPPMNRIARTSCSHSQRCGRPGMTGFPAGD